MSFLAVIIQNKLDAVVLARVLDGVDRDDIPAALGRYEAARKERTAKIQIGSGWASSLSPFRVHSPSCDRVETTGCGKAARRTGSTAMTPGTCRWPPDFGDPERIAKKRSHECGPKRMCYPTTDG
jgi:hypothetical protein